MLWSRMRFRDGLVWIRVDASGAPVADGAGRAHMKYRLEDSKEYRPAAANLGAVAAGDEDAQTRGTPSARSAPDDAGVIHVWTDGACSGNPGPMGLGVVVVADGKRREWGEYLGEGTNNIAELTAIERGLELAAKIDPTMSVPVRVYSDSSYAIGLLSLGWKAKANKDLVARIREVVAARPAITFVKVAGHSGVPENEMCDELARRAIETR